MPSNLCSSLEDIIRTDPANRGLLRRDEDRIGWRRGHLLPAARSLAEQGSAIAIVTGFAIPMPEGPVAETDGPPGAVLLAEVLASLGQKVILVTDEPCSAVLRLSAELAGLPVECVEVCPVEPARAACWVTDFLSRRSLSHLVAIERVGPAHTPETVGRQAQSSGTSVEQFRQWVAEEHWGRAHNMRGEIIDDFTAPLHLLFDQAVNSPHPPATIGIGDGGNEIGLGAISWWELADRLGEKSAAIPCATRTDWTILCGVSNWGAQALAVSVASLQGRAEVLRHWTVERQRELLKRIVREGPAVDGAARAHRPTVDGLTDEQYFIAWREMERLLSLR